MKTLHESARARLRALVLITVGLASSWLAAVPGTAHAGVAGTVVGWGNNDEGQLNVPEGLSDAVAIAGGGFHTVALRSNGTVVAWGYNYGG
ncbi:hypothetical protein [Azohydromonas lata]|uniref:Regulator of chromosome condensation (RCC1) repeat-containing protein n=1 Tax=Azohydromonas lata TaxID=45677 RepID=A0ABU5IQE3_9BURK|nr:hypothetical protein [Azohydromonas lata]MDZ5461100.1 hypothetical protein [Azohydromonas lata]